MNITITDRDKYIKHCDVKQYLNADTDKIERYLFGHKVILGNNQWLWHVHIKFCERCNARCAFCIEQHSHRQELPKKVISNADIFLRAMRGQGILYSVSVTGGEPTLMPEFADLCVMLKAHDIKFLTMNTNGSLLHKVRPFVDGLFDFVDISRHSIDDAQNSSIFKTITVPTLDELKQLKQSFTRTKMRMQCVMQSGMTVEQFLKMLEAYSFADNVSFRRLMNPFDWFTAYNDTFDDQYFQILDWVAENGEFIEQTIQDYYVYEIWNVNGVNVTFSYSDMKSLDALEKVEDEANIREFIIHPDGIVAGSWLPDRKIILT